MWLKMSSAISDHWKARGVTMPKLSSLESTLPEAMPPMTTNLASWQLLVFSGCVYSDANVLVRNQSSTQVIHLIQIRLAVHHILEHPSIMSSNRLEEFRRKMLPWFFVLLRQCARIFKLSFKLYITEKTLNINHNQYAIAILWIIPLHQN